MIRGRQAEQQYGRPCSTLVIGSDHGGFALKSALIKLIKDKYEKTGLSLIDVGTFSEERVDYVDFCSSVCRMVQDDPRGETRGLMVDGAGVASGITCNKHTGIRCGVCNDHFTALMGRQHNDINVVSMGGKAIGPLVAMEVVDVLLTAKFEGDRHVPRLEKIQQIESSQAAALIGTAVGSLGSGAGARSAGGGMQQSASPFKLPL